MNDIHQQSLDFSGPIIEGPKERGERLAAEMLAKAMQDRAANPNIVEAPSADIRELRSLPHVQVDFVDDSITAGSTDAGNTVDEGTTYTREDVIALVNGITAKNNEQRANRGLPPITAGAIAENSRLVASQYLSQLDK